MSNVAKPIVIATRGSALALAQANLVFDQCRAAFPKLKFEIKIIKTTGDKITDVSLAQVGTKGMFTKEIEEALAARQVDLAVHSLKDLPTELPPGFEIAAITKREDPRDRAIELVPGRHSSCGGFAGYSGRRLGRRTGR